MLLVSFFCVLSSCSNTKHPLLGKWQLTDLRFADGTNDLLAIAITVANEATTVEIN